MDAGKTWVQAELEGPDLGPNAWRAFSYSTELPRGEYRAVSRATDTQGDSQPRERVENERGYGHNSWLEAALTVSIVDVLPAEAVAADGESTLAGAEPPAPRKEVTLSEAGKEGRLSFTETAQPPCGVCHTVSEAGTEGAVGPNLDQLKPDLERVESAVTNGVGAMPAYGNTLSSKEIKDLAEYVVEATR